MWYVTVIEGRSKYDHGSFPSAKAAMAYVKRHRLPHFLIENAKHRANAEEKG